MTRNVEYLDPAKKLVDEVVAWLCKEKTDNPPSVTSPHVKVVDGAHSLAHVMVVVPTAQSGRNLRLALAREASKRKWGGIIPPKVVLPMQLVKPAEETLREATPTEAAVAFQQYVKTHRAEVQACDRIVGLDAFNDATADELTARFALFDQLEDIWRALAGRGLLMCDVPTLGKATLEADIGDERERWEQLAKLEAGYFAYLHDLGVAYPTERVCAAKTHAAIVDDAIEEIVLPALTDPVRVLGDVLEQQLAAGKRVTVLLHAKETDADAFDAWGWPKTRADNTDEVWKKLSNKDIVCATNSSALARVAAEDFPSGEKGVKLPSIVLCDGDLYQGVASAFLNRGYVVHNPERHYLAQSSLGRLIKDLMALYPEGDLPWSEFMSVLRSADVQSALDLTAERRASVLRGADIAQNAFIPAVIPKDFAFPVRNDIQSWQQEDFAAFCEVGRQLESLLDSVRKGASLGAFLRQMLKVIFAAHTVGERAEEKEFFAAAEGTRKFLASLESDFVAALNPTNVEFKSLARRALSEVVYSLEPDSQDAIKTEGWLELPWTMGKQVALVGLHEGKVPDTIVGHPFLPDALRKELGLVTNEDRLVRDTWILKELLSSHDPSDVRAYVARTNDDGDICRPSRLLYLCPDADLPERVQALFGDLPVERKTNVRRTDSPLALRDEVKLPDHFSASALDTYVKCPFTYYLKYGLNMRVYKEKRELEANDFGTFVHDVLECYAKRQIERSKRGEEQLTDADAIRREIMEEIVPIFRARFVKPTLNIDLQLNAAEGRLSLFAEKQAEWARQGWRIREAEYELDDVVPELGVRINGRIDRVDENIHDDVDKHWCLIDYKTWDEKKLTNRVVTSDKQTEKNAAHLDLARALGFPCLVNKNGRECQRMLSVQLPVYGKGYAAKHPELSFADMAFSYFILGKNAEETGIGEAKKTLLSDGQVDAAIATAKRAIELIAKGIFWPPGPTDEWKWDFPWLFLTDPTVDLGETDWAKRQQKKLEASHA